MKKKLYLIFILILCAGLCFGLCGCGEQSGETAQIDFEASTDEELIAMRDQINQILESRNQDDTSSESSGEFDVSVIGKENHELLQSYLDEIGNIYEADEYEKLMQEKPEINIELFGYNGKLEYGVSDADENTGAKKIYYILFETETYLSDYEFEKLVDNISSYWNEKLEQDSNGLYWAFNQKQTLCVELNRSNNHAIINMMEK